MQLPLGLGRKEQKHSRMQGYILIATQNISKPNAELSNPCLYTTIHIYSPTITFILHFSFSQEINKVITWDFLLTKKPTRKTQSARGQQWISGKQNQRKQRESLITNVRQGVTAKNKGHQLCQLNRRRESGYGTAASSAMSTSQNENCSRWQE